MNGKYTNSLQAAILYDGKADVWPSMDLNNFRMAMLERGIPLKITQEAATFAFMMGPEEIQLTVTYYDKPADHAVFAQTLKSAATRLIVPDAIQRVLRHQSHVLVEIQQGVFGGVDGDPQISKMFDDIGFPRPGHSLAAFNKRVDLLGEVCRWLQKEKPASVIHWTQSNTLLPAAKMDAFLDRQNPGMLTVHPILVAGETVPGYDELPVEILTLGAADFIGREIHIKAAPIPWMDLYESALAFIRLAIMPNGYVIPDGDTFGIESGEFSYLVRHLDGGARPTVTDTPLYELKLQFHRKYNYIAPDFNGREHIKGGLRQAARMVPGHPAEAREAIAEWERKDRMARGAGGSFEVYKKNNPNGEAPAPSVPSGGLLGRVAAVFGRKR